MNNSSRRIYMVFFGLLLFSVGGVLASVGGVLAMEGSNSEGEIISVDDDGRKAVDGKSEHEHKKDVDEDYVNTEEEVDKTKKEEDILGDLKKEVNKTTWFKSNVIEKWSNLGVSEKWSNLDPKYKKVLKYSAIGGATFGVSAVALLNRGKIGRACSGSLGYMKKLVLRRSSV